jgi:two-component system chemotaxis response regulator CheY
MKCVVADSSPLMRRILTNVLRSGGCEEILVAENGSQALEACDAETNLLVTAWNLPEVNGLEVTRNLRQGEGTAGVKVLLVTPRNSRTDVMNAKDAGVDGYLLRPFTPEDLRSCVQKLLEARPTPEEGAPADADSPASDTETPEAAAA